MNKLGGIVAYGYDSDSEDIYSDNNVTQQETGNLNDHRVTTADKEPKEVKEPNQPETNHKQVDPEVISRLNDYADKKILNKFDLLSSINSNKEFSNPNILSKAVSYFDIDEVGSNYPENVFDPHKLHFDSDNVTVICPVLKPPASASNMEQQQQMLIGQTAPAINMASTGFINTQAVAAQAAVALAGGLPVPATQLQYHIPGIGMANVAAGAHGGSSQPAVHTFTSSVTGTKRKSRFA